jgi:hypothetical protein
MYYIPVNLHRYGVYECNASIVGSITVQGVKPTILAVMMDMVVVNGRSCIITTPDHNSFCIAVTDFVETNSLVGIVTFPISCVYQNNPSVFAVFHSVVIDFISQVINKELNTELSIVLYYIVINLIVIRIVKIDSFAA